MATKRKPPAAGGLASSKKRKPKAATKPDSKGVVHFDQEKEVRAIARERIGVVKSTRVIVPKTERKNAQRKPKHKKPPGEEE